MRNSENSVEIHHIVIVIYFDVIHDDSNDQEFFDYFNIFPKNFSIQMDVLRMSQNEIYEKFLFKRIYRGFLRWHFIAFYRIILQNKAIKVILFIERYPILS